MYKRQGTDSTNSVRYVTKLTTGGEEYKRNVMAYYDKEVLDTYNDTLLTDNTYTVYLDANGYFVGVELFEGTKNYVFITGFDRDSSNLSVKTATASAIFLDGTMKNIQVNVTDTDKNIDKVHNLTGDARHNASHFIKWSTGGYSDLGNGLQTGDSAWAQAGKYGEDGIYDLNQWYTYTEDDGTYTLKPCVRMTKTTYEKTDKTTTIRTDALLSLIHILNVHFAQHLEHRRVSTRARREEAQPPDEFALWKLLQAERLSPAGVTLWLTWQLGLRLEEIVTLRWDQLHGETLRLPDRIVPLTSGVLGVLSDLRAASPDAVYILTAPRSGRPYDRTRLSKIVRTALVRAGLDNITLRDLRLDCDIRVGGENEVTAFLRRHQSITRNEAAELLQVSASTAYNRLKQMAVSYTHLHVS